jgi:hypothetical protein
MKSRLEIFTFSFSSGSGEHDRRHALGVGDGPFQLPDPVHRLP